MQLLTEIVDWTEVWATLIPLFAAINYSRQPITIRPVVIYFWIALVLNLTADLIWKQGKLNLALPIDNNNPLYNTHSILRVLLFSWFFNKLNQPLLKTFKMFIPYIFLAFVFINFKYFDNYFDRKISYRLHTVEAGILVFFCLQYYISLLLANDQTFPSQLPTFWVVTGLSFFVMTSFPIYLFYNTLLSNHLEFAKRIWIAPKTSFLIFCILTSKAFTMKTNE